MTIRFYGYKKGEDTLGTSNVYSKDSKQNPVSYFSMYAWALDNRYDLVIEVREGFPLEALKSEASSLFFVPEYPLRLAQGEWKNFDHAIHLFPELEEFVDKVIALEFLRSS